MARTPLAQRIQDTVTSLDPTPGQTRRDFLKRAGAVGALATAAAVSPGWLPAANAATAPRIAVVGGGLAGLTAAYRLKQAGYTAQVYEASSRIGGRCWTNRGAFAGGQIVERGGELIDTGHTAMRQLVRELGLKLENLLNAQPEGSQDFFWFDGAPYSQAQALADFKAIYPKVQKDATAAGYPTLYTASTKRGRELDQMSIIDWIDESVPGGTRSKLGQLLDVAYTIEYGAESSRQSALNLLYLLSGSGRNELSLYGESDEKFHVAGGNDQVTTRLADKLAGQISLGSELIAIKRNANGSYALTITGGGTSRTVTADQVVLALPFSMLRAVDHSKAGFNAIKTTAIKELAMGTNSKLHVQFTGRPWENLGNNGNTYSDRGSQTTWDVTRAQPGAQGILVNFSGGTIGAGFGSGTPTSRAQQFLTQIEPVLPGVSQKFNGKATIDHWAGYRWTKGSYSYWGVGQYTRFAGAEGEASGNCHFAGEHTSVDYQGYLNGAVETGARAAQDILTALK